MSEWTAIRDLGGAEGGEASLRGWLCGRRRGGKIVFLQLRDGTGVCQCVVEASHCEAFALAQSLGLESSLTLRGTVRRDARAPGGYEVAILELRVIQAAEGYPISRKAHGVEFLFSQRHLWLRSSRPWAILRVRHAVERACREFFDRRGYVLVDTPILVAGAGEEAQSLFEVDYFDRPAFLTQTGQLHLESACMAFGKVYCFGPTFRAEKSKTRRHLTEFWMVEPEVAFAGLAEIMALAEDLVCEVTAAVLGGHAEELRLLGRDAEPLRRVVKPFPRLKYDEAVERLRHPDTIGWLEREYAAARRRMEDLRQQLECAEEARAVARQPAPRDKHAARVAALREEIRELEEDLGNRPDHIRAAREFEWGRDLGGSDETILAGQFDRPVFVTHYPRQAKAFYMKSCPEDPRVVLNMDLLAPEGYGEIVGGSVREDDGEVMARRMREKGLDRENYGWYADLRRYGSVPHGGFGLGLERLLAWLCGLRHVREAIAFPRVLGTFQGEAGM